MKTLYTGVAQVLYFYTDANGGDVAEHEWDVVNKANPMTAARLLARVNFVALAQGPRHEARSDVYDIPGRLWLFAWGDYAIFYTLHPLILPDQDVHIVGVAPNPSSGPVTTEMFRRAALIHA